jgi:predicted nucleic acid-binding Zn ribbon protein
MADRLVQHKHCPVCQKAMSASKDTCSAECAERWESQRKEKKRTLYLFYVSIAVLVVVLALQFLGGT